MLPKFARLDYAVQRQDHVGWNARWIGEEAEIFARSVVHCEGQAVLLGIAC